VPRRAVSRHSRSKAGLALLGNLVALKRSPVRFRLAPPPNYVILLHSLSNDKDSTCPRLVPSSQAYSAVESAISVSYLANSPLCPCLQN
jgi:hypothetical protein